MATPKLTIIIPVYNVEDYLTNCIESILNQSFNDYEVIMIDDGSTDNSGIICDQYAEKDRRIKVIHKSNGGVSSARNTGIEQANGEWIYFCDADDELSPNGLMAFIYQISPEIDLVASSFERIPKENINRKKTIHSRTEFTSRSYAYTLFKGINGEYQGYLWSKIFRASVIKENRILFDTEISYNEDRLFLLRFLLISKRKVVYFPDKTYTYFIRESGAMKSLESPKGYIKFRSDLDALLKMKTIASLAKDTLLQNLIDKSIFISGERNKILVRKFSENPKRELKEITSLVISSIGVWCFYRKAIKRIIKTVLIQKITIV